MRNRKLIITVVVLLVAGSALYVGWILHQGFSTRTSPGAMESSLAIIMRNAAIPSRYRTMKNPVTETPEVIHEGMAHWADHCATCHANNGAGDTMYGKTMYPRPPDMRRKNTQKMSDGQLYYTIKNGIRLTGMPAFGDPGDDDIDSWKLVAFIRHLPQLTEREDAEMEHLNPKGPEEWQEEMEEEQFLNGGKATAPPQPHMHH